MVRNSSAESFDSLKQAETDIAVLQVQFQNTEEKIDGLKEDVKGLREHIDIHNEANQRNFKEFKESNDTLIAALSTKVGELHKWAWMILGGVALAGALGSDVIGKFLSAALGLG